MTAHTNGMYQSSTGCSFTAGTSVRSVLIVDTVILTVSILIIRLLLGS